MVMNTEVGGIVTISTGGAWKNVPVPSIPTFTSLTPGDTQVTLNLTAAGATDTIYARYKPWNVQAWSSESETFKRTGSGSITITGLTNEVLYDFAIYAKTGSYTSDWDTDKATPTDPSTPAQPEKHNWDRWIYSSIEKHFADRKSGLNLHIEGEPHDSKDQQEGLELRIDGPYVAEKSKGLFYLLVEINVLITTYMSDTDYHKHRKNTGIALAMFTNGIPIYKYGNTQDDDDSLLGCFMLQSSGDRERLQVSHFGQIDRSVKLQQSTVEGHYLMILEE